MADRAARGGPGALANTTRCDVFESVASRIAAAGELLRESERLARGALALAIEAGGRLASARVPYLSDKTLETAFNGQAVDRGEARPSASNDFIEERRTASTEADERPLQRGDHPVVRELSRLGRSLGVRRGRARPDLRSAPRRGLAPEGPCPGARSSVRKLWGRPKGLPGASSRLEGQLHEHPRAQAEPLPCISARMLSVP